MIRPAVDTDIPFIYSTWSDSFRYDCYQGNKCKNEFFYKDYIQVMDTILKAPETKIIVESFDEDPFIILGYLVYDSKIAYYCFVKHAFRHKNIAKNLFNHAFKDSKEVYYTFKTREVEGLLKLKQDRLVHRPYLLYKGVSNG